MDGFKFFLFTVLAEAFDHPLSVFTSYQIPLKLILI